MEKSQLVRIIIIFATFFASAESRANISVDQEYLRTNLILRSGYESTIPISSSEKFLQNNCDCESQVDCKCCVSVELQTFNTSQKGWYRVLESLN